MPTLTITKTYSDGDILTESDLDNIRTDVTTFINTTKLDADNLQDAAVTAAKIAANAVTTGKIADDAVTTDKIADGSITADKLSGTVGDSVGTVKQFYDFNGELAIPRGWMRMNGDIVNETNYNAEHGSGAYTTDSISDSAILNKNLPSMNDRYLVGANATTQDGTSSISSVGNSGNEVALVSHTHAHNHKWYETTVTDVNGGGPIQYERTGEVYNSSGAAVSPEVSADLEFGAGNSSGVMLFIDETDTGAGNTKYAGGNPANNTSGTYTYYTDNDSTANSSATQDIQPESIEIVFIMKVI